MKKKMSYVKIILGCFLIAAALNLFFIGQHLVPAGIFGLTVLYAEKLNISLWIIVIFANLIFLFFSIIALSKKKTKKTLVSFILIPLFTFLTKDIGTYIDMGSIDTLLLSLYGGVLIGLGSRLIYKENHYVSGSDIVADIEHYYTKAHYNIVNYLFDMAVLIIVAITNGIESAMYSLISIIIIEILSKRANLGTSDSKVFYIITKKDREVRNYIIDELGYTLTVFDVKGGFLKTKNTVLMTVIPTKDYYKLREGVKLIDPTAFISITDSYEVINTNKDKKYKHENN